MGAVGLGADLDGDFVSDFVARSWSEQYPTVYWVGSSQWGELGVGDALATIRVADGIEEITRDRYQATDAFPFDVEGDGVDESLVVLGAQRDEGSYGWEHLGWAWILPSGAVGDTMDEAADIVIHDEAEALREVAAFGDLDGNGYEDLVVALDGALALLSGPFGGNVSILDAASRVDVDVDLIWGLDDGDMDGDGGTDILFHANALGDTEEDIYVVSDLAVGGTMDAARLRLDHQSPEEFWPLYLYDVDEDGRDDLAGRYVFLTR